MRRCAIKLLLFLVLGAMINVAVAWAFAVGSRQPVSQVRNVNLTYPDQGEWKADGYCLQGSHFIEWRRPFLWWQYPHTDLSDAFVAEESPEVGSLPQWSIYDPQSDHDSQVLTTIIEGAHGWPLLAISSLSQFGLDDTSSRGVSKRPRVGMLLPEYYWMVPPSASIEDQFDAIASAPVLPVCPIWPGFAINTIFYAAILWLLFATPGFVRRRVRRFRGRCIHCGYDLRGHVPGAGADSTKCPECGRSSPLPRGEGSGVRVQAECNSP